MVEAGGAGLSPWPPVSHRRRIGHADDRLLERDD
jgi:hypothetical protein